MKRPPSVSIVGAGMSGSLMAICLAQRGYRVEVFESRQDMRETNDLGGRSFKMTLSRRGLSVLDEVGLLDRVLPQCVALHGRRVHGRRGEISFSPYGRSSGEVLYSCTRNVLNATLLDCAEEYPNVDLRFGMRCVNLDKKARQLVFLDRESQQQRQVGAELVIGADGAFSTVRRRMQRGRRADYRQEFLAWGYKELTIPAAEDGSYLIDKHSLHVWARGDALLLALPNSDGSFNCLCVLPFEGERGFSTLGTEAAVAELFRREFPDVYELVPGIVEEFLGKPTGFSLTSSTDPWYEEDWIALIGDACHSVVPYYGQGMIAAFEDCLVLREVLERHRDDRAAALRSYQQLRKDNTDALARLSLANFDELRQRAESPLLWARKKVELQLNRLFPSRWIPIYTMVAHTRMPYADVLEKSAHQRRLARWSGLEVVVWLLASLRALFQGVRGLSSSRNGTSASPPGGGTPGAASGPVPSAGPGRRPEASGVVEMAEEAEGELSGDRTAVCQR